MPPLAWDMGRDGGRAIGPPSQPDRIRVAESAAWDQSKSVRERGIIVRTRQPRQHWHCLLPVPRLVVVRVWRFDFEHGIGNRIWNTPIQQSEYDAKRKTYSRTMARVLCTFD